MSKGKPFLKWVGGKGQLIEQLEALLPADLATRKQFTYVEPFVGGGAMLFHMLKKFDNISYAVINDINPDLAASYEVVRDAPHELITCLEDLQCSFYALETEELQKMYYLDMRMRFNEMLDDKIERTAAMLFLNKTCFNGLYRVNKNGKFNVPFGRYTNPQICNAATILADSELLQRVEIRKGDFDKTLKYASSNAMFYLDPPYRPLNLTSSFTSYAKEDFNDEAQLRLKDFCDTLSEYGVRFMLSNSDSKIDDSEDSFFDKLYSDYRINRVWASRSINSNAQKRGKLTEIIVCNYENIHNATYAGTHQVCHEFAKNRQLELTL